MKNWYKNAQTNPLELDSNEYVANVPTYIICDSRNVDVELLSYYVNIKYNIDMDKRTWGIKGFEVYAFDTIEIEVKQIIYEEKGTSGTESETIISVDLGKLNHEEKPGDGVRLAELNLHVTPDLKVDYNSSFLKVIK